MSDGPHRSLRMRQAWRWVAKRCDKRAFTATEISEALVPAVEQDCREDFPPQVLERVRRIAQEPSLFKGDFGNQIAPLKAECGHGLGQSFLDNVDRLSTSDADAFSAVQDALAAALEDRAHRGAWQVEEHYLREAPSPRARDVRGRLEEAIGCTDFAALAARILSVDRQEPSGMPKKRTDVDDGVKLR